MDAFPQAGGDKLKSYWSRPGGKFGVIVALGVFAIAAHFLFPILTTIVWDTVHFGIALICGALFLYIVTNRKLRLGFFYLWEILMRKFVGLVVELDPFVIAEDNIRDMEKQREMLYEKSVEVDTQKESLNMKLAEKDKQMKHEFATAEAAKKNNMLPELANATRQMERLKIAAQQLVPIRDSLSKISDYLTKVYKNSKYLIDDAKATVDLQKDVYASVTKGNAALNSAMKIFKGDPEKKLMAEQAAGMLQEDIAGKLANMKKALSSTTDFMRSIDLDNATFEVEGLKMLETYTPESFTKLTAQEDRIAVPIELGKVNTSEYDNLLK